ncbi:hypothetical protein MAA_11575 [Metarhizium robertsii ARSEF 23]|uniref:Uncharacterized protein n=1 Tax=Metarhizium robertsii (strain ARSEF 23 / ATCC MYA-3075) TaxID=655844 RepID=A0A0B2XFL0_METRA|nr:uncharacterized protein MAA_11575 [Metarhizium robertsii ARSEF 23]KHO10814.1 hypothetical protein MAA_11575 [Metarhizium robertsii ARSEF 23]
MDRQETRLRRGSKVAARLVAPAPPRQALETPEEAAEAQECSERHKNVAGRAGQRYQLAVSPRRDPTAMATILRAWLRRQRSPGQVHDEQCWHGTRHVMHVHGRARQDAIDGSWLSSARGPGARRLASGAACWVEGAPKHARRPVVGARKVPGAIRHVGTRPPVRLAVSSQYY